MIQECAICGEPTTEEVCEDCEVQADAPRLVDMSDDDFIDQFDLGAMQ